MAKYYDEPSHTFSEYLLVPSYTSAECTPQNVSLKTPVCKFRVGESSPLNMSIPLVSAVMQSVSGEKLAAALAREGRITLHITLLAADNSHHAAEAAFKGVGMALAQALSPAAGDPSTKGLWL